MHRNIVMHTQLGTNVMKKSTLKNWQRKKTIPLADYLSNMITRDPQIDHTADKELLK